MRKKLWWGNLKERDGQEELGINGDSVRRIVGGRGLYMIQDRDKYGALVNTAWSLQVP
jgi:hypothetical protein